MQTPSSKYQQSFNEKYRKSVYQKRHHQLMIEYLIQELGFEQDLAWMIVQIHQCSNLAETMNLFITGDDGKYQHFFIPSNFVIKKQLGEQEQIKGIKKVTKEQENQSQLQSQQKKQIMCRVCSQSIQSHNYVLGEDEFQNIFEKQFREYVTYKQKNRSYRKSGIKSQISQQQEQKGDSYSLDPLLFKKYSGQSLYQNHIEPEKLILCEICYDSHPSDQIVKINGVYHNICYLCMNQYLKQQIINRRINTMNCPHCAQNLTSQFIKSIVSNVIFQKYQTFLKNIEIQNNPNLRWCPNPKCSVVIHSKDKKKIVCPKCESEICAKCNREYHPKISCDAVLQKQIKNLQNAKDIQKCRKCKALVEKISGCNHMTCTVCRYQWCWLCGSTYSYIHFSSLNPLGCAGLQNGHHSKWGKCRIVSLRILILLALIILFPILLPLVMIFCGPGIVVTLIWDRICRNNHCCLKLCLCLILFPFGFILDPFVWIWAIFYFTPRICSEICDWFEHRRYIHTNSQNILKRRLLEQGDIVDA